MELSGNNNKLFFRVLVGIGIIENANEFSSDMTGEKSSSCRIKIAFSEVI